MRYVALVVMILLIAAAGVFFLRGSAGVTEAPVALMQVGETLHFGENAQFSPSQEPVYVVFFPFHHGDGPISSDVVFEWSDGSTSEGGYGGFCAVYPKGKIPIYKYAYAVAKSGAQPVKFTIEGKAFDCKVSSLPEFQQIVSANHSKFQ